MMESKKMTSTNLVLSLLGIMLALILTGVATGRAAEIIVDADGECTLAEAIESANNDTAGGNGCVDGAWRDTIILLTDVNLSQPLPHITSRIILKGNGHTIDAGNNRAVGTIFWTEPGSWFDLYNTTLTGADSEGPGGAIHNESNLELHGCTIKGNAAARGGGLYTSGTFLYTVITTFSDNTATEGGGIYITNPGDRYSAVFIACTVSRNQANRGGGIFNNINSSGIRMVISTISGNTADEGAGILNTGTFTLSSSTVSNNFARDKGGGLCTTAMNTDATTDLQSNLIAGNRAGTAGQEICNQSNGTGQATTRAGNYNLFGHGGENNSQAFVGFVAGSTDITATSDGTDPTQLAAILDPVLADNGGYYLLPHTWTHALVAGSPAIDSAGDNGWWDQRIYHRPAGIRNDIGAFEFEAVPICGAGRHLPANTWFMAAPSCNIRAQGFDGTVTGQLGSDLGGVYGTNWISFAWNPETQTYGNPMAADDELITGKGHWLYSTNPGMMTLEGELNSRETCPASMAPARHCFHIPLTVDGNGTTRWNLVGYPFPASTDWADVRISVNGVEYSPSEAEAAGIISKTYFRWNGNAYESFDDATQGMTGTLQPQESVWVRTMPGVAATEITLWIHDPWE